MIGLLPPLVCTPDKRLCCVRKVPFQATVVRNRCHVSGEISDIAVRKGTRGWGEDSGRDVSRGRARGRGTG